MALLYALPRAQTVKAITNCDLNVLSKSDLDHILEKFPKFYERMARIAAVINSYLLTLTLSFQNFCFPVLLLTFVIIFYKN